jgi:Spy/CpxP family protein refolding chaperone
MMYLERTWAAVAFVCNASRDQLAKLRPTYQEAYTSRRKAFEKAREAHDFEAIQKASENARKTIDAKLKQVLSSDQIAKLKKWQDNQEAVARKLFAQGANAPRGTLRDVMYIERSWAALTFEVKVSDDQLQKLRSAAYAAAWAKREKALQSGDVTALGKTTASIKTDVDAKIKQVLTAAQWQQFQQWQTRRGRLGRGGGGPGPGAGRGRGMGR